MRIILQPQKTKDNEVKVKKVEEAVNGKQQAQWMAELYCSRQRQVVYFPVCRGLFRCGDGGGKVTHGAAQRRGAEVP